MTVIEQPKERAWEEGAASTIALMGSINLATAQLVATFRMLIDTEGWHGGGIQTLEHWVTWQAGVAPRRVASYRAGQLLGIHPGDRTVSRSLRRVIERRDQGCTHPLCARTRWLHVHHIVHWAQRGLTMPSNLLCLCPTHHRQLHDGELTIEGNPEDRTLRFCDARGRPIEPPPPGPPRQLRLDEPSPFTPPFGERLDPRWFGWN